MTQTRRQATEYTRRRVVDDGDDGSLRSCLETEPDVPSVILTYWRIDEPSLDCNSSSSAVSTSSVRWCNGVTSPESPDSPDATTVTFFILCNKVDTSWSRSNGWMTSWRGLKHLHLNPFKNVARGKTQCYKCSENFNKLQCKYDFNIQFKLYTKKHILKEDNNRTKRCSLEYEGLHMDHVQPPSESCSNYRDSVRSTAWSWDNSKLAPRVRSEVAWFESSRMCQHRSTNTQVYKHTGLQTNRSTNTQVYKHTGLQTHRSTNTLVYKQTGLQTHRSTNTQVYKHCNRSPLVLNQWWDRDNRNSETKRLCSWRCIFAPYICN